MLFKMDPRKVGCGTKIGFESLTKVRDLAGLGHFDDATPFECGGVSVTQTIDTIGRFCQSETAFVETSVQHCINDLVAVGSRAEALAASITYGPEYETDTEMAGLVRKLLLACAARNIQLTNLHSLAGNYSSLTLSAIGPKCEREDIGLTGPIFLSRPIGNFKMGVLREAEAINGSLWFAAARANPLSRKPTGVQIMTDVTGFGLAGSLLAVARRLGLRCDVALTREHAVDPDVVGLPFQCMTEDLRNEIGLSFNNERARQIGSCRELCGPFIMLAEHGTSLESIRKTGAPAALQIGKFVRSSLVAVRINHE